MGDKGLEPVSSRVSSSSSNAKARPTAPETPFFCVNLGNMRTHYFGAALALRGSHNLADTKQTSQALRNALGLSHR